MTNEGREGSLGTTAAGASQASGAQLHNIAVFAGALEGLALAGIGGTEACMNASDTFICMMTSGMRGQQHKRAERARDREIGKSRDQEIERLVMRRGQGGTRKVNREGKEGRPRWRQSPSLVQARFKKRRSN